MLSCKQRNKVPTVSWFYFNSEESRIHCPLKMKRILVKALFWLLSWVEPPSIDKPLGRVVQHMVEFSHRLNALNRRVNCFANVLVDEKM